MFFRGSGPKFVFWASVFLCLFSISGFAQTSFGRISGTITDSSGGSIAGVKVKVTNSDTQQSRDVTADANGFYIVTNLPIGPYNVEVEQPGFKRQQKSGFNVSADSNVNADFALTIGDVTQSVDVVTAQAETLNTVSGELSRVIDNKQVQNVPLNGRTYTQLLTLVPGASVTNPDQFSVTTSLSATNQTINGNRSDTNNLTVDGAFNLVAGSNGSLMNNVSPDFVNEVKVQTSNFSAEYGRTSGAAFNVATKSGTNEFHGSAFEYFRNEVLDARNFFIPQKAPLRFNDFGYTFGGPIVKNKLFFFVGEEWKRLRQSQTATRQTVPSSALLGGNFSGLAPIYVPGTNRTQQYAGNRIPVSQITPDGRAIANVYRLMSEQGAGFNDSNTPNNLTLAPRNDLNFREDLVRIDYRINDKHSLYGRWINDTNEVYDPFGTFSGSNLPTTPTLRSRPGKSYLIAETWVPRANLVNEIRANASWASQRIPPTGNTWLRDTYGFQFQQVFAGGDYDNGIPSVDIQQFANFRGPSFALRSPTTDIQLADTLSILTGSHTIKIGGVYIRDRIDQNGRPQYTGIAGFNTSGNPNSTGNAFADALLGNFQSYSESSADPVGFFRFSQPEAFIQDSWKVNRKLSLDIGLRYAYLQPIYLQANNAANFDPARFNPAQAVTVQRTPQGRIVPGSGNLYNGLVVAGAIPSDEAGRVPGAGTGLFNTIPSGGRRGFIDPKHTFGPRIGFAYSADDKTVLRGGFGMFYYRPQGNMIFSQVNLPPILQNAQYNNGNLANISGGAQTLNPQGTINALSPNIKASYTEQFSFSIQRQLPLDMLMETSYVGTLSRNQLRQPNINQPFFDQVAANPNNSINASRPFSGYSAINQYLSDSTSNYHALQVYVSKRAGAVTATGGYTWSKNLTDASAFNEAAENYPDRHYNYGPASFDRRHVFFSTFVLSLPSLKGQNAIVKNVAGSWQLSGIVRLQTGQYYSVTANDVLGTRRADYRGGNIQLADGQRTTNRWFNTGAFGLAPLTRFGNSATGILQGPGLQVYDLSVMKFFDLGERFKLRFQGDFYNAFNVANFILGSTTTTSNAFGTLSGAYPGRNLQFGLKLIF